MIGRSALLLALLVGGCGRSSDEVVVFAAASLTDVATAAASRVEATGTPVVVSVGASADLARQIERGAPADLFLSADPAWVRYLESRAGRVQATEAVAEGRLVVVGPSGTPAAPTVEAALAGDGRIALGDPAYVPAGTYARRALRSLGLWNAVERRLVPQADVRAALAAVETGAVPRGIVYASDAAISDRVTTVATFDASATGTIRYEAAVLSNRGRLVLDALTDSTGRAAFVRAGFVSLDP